MVTHIQASHYFMNFFTYIIGWEDTIPLAMTPKPTERCIQISGHFWIIMGKNASVSCTSNKSIAFQSILIWGYAHNQMSYKFWKFCSALKLSYQHILRDMSNEKTFNALVFRNYYPTLTKSIRILKYLHLFEVWTFLQFSVYICWTYLYFQHTRISTNCQWWHLKTRKFNSLRVRSYYKIADFKSMQSHFIIQMHHQLVNNQVGLMIFWTQS